MSREPDVNRRTLLKAGAGLAALALLEGCGTGGSGVSGGGSPLTGMPAASTSLDAITRVAIHPAIGIARVGNSATEYFIGPEALGPTREPAGGFKDASGALKRQAARFRVYGYDAAGRVVRELTNEDARITWTVHVANKKAAWYDFDTALDVPIAQPAFRRNPAIIGTQRDALVIDPGPRSISGVDVIGPRFDSGTFQGVPVPLGELRTDDAGRLLFLGGFGHSFSPAQAPLTTFANNEGWCDDTSDGPVRATVMIGNRSFEADPAWVITAPPNYGPAIAEGYITMYDVVYDTMVARGWITPATVSFAADIHPLFSRLVDMQWLNAGILRDNGPGTPGDYTAPAFVAMLGDPGSKSASLRQQMFAQFRNPAFQQPQAPPYIPNMYGDEVSVPASTPEDWLSVTPTQFRALGAWAGGAFSVEPVERFGVFEAVPLSQQPAMLDRAALDACLGGAFHPGCEATWPLRHATMYAAPFRFNVADPQAPPIDYGDALTPETAVAADGPLRASGPGDVTRWMAVPWQSDTASCRSGYEPAIDPYLPTFWPARVPNQILTESDYNTVMNTALPKATRLAAFNRRSLWLRHIVDQDTTQSLTRMVASWYQLGLVTEKPGPSDLALPSTFKVETLNTFTTPPLSKTDVRWQLARPRRS